ncbi:MAG: hypothetical protein DWQ36_07485 [Acidobacteria bacterium]|nr:MAG: hypothetical protein DWQ30_11830 [Acidobacteriota bacterium]REK09159.1 MAG: hypothetical protein DWQ36_07485 [Acidobacteriota bacterium]
MHWKRPFAAFVAAALLSTLTMQSVSAQRGRGVMSSELKAELRKSPRQVPVFKPGLTQEQKLATIAEIDRAVKSKRPSGAMAEAVTIWESMSQDDKLRALSGETAMGTFAIAAGVVLAMAAGMAVGAAVGVAQAKAGGKEELQMRAMSAAELDALSGPDMRSSLDLDEVALDYAVVSR